MLKLVNLVAEETAGSRDATLLLASINVFCSAVPFGVEIQQKCLQRLLSLLFNRYPKVRSTTADSLYTVLLTYESSMPVEGFEQSLEVLTSTPWDGKNTKLIKEQRNKLYGLLQVPEPDTASAPSAAASSSVARPAPPAAKSAFGYEDLVREGAD